MQFVKISDRENKLSKFEEIVKLQNYPGLKTMIFSCKRSSLNIFLMVLI